MTMAVIKSFTSLGQSKKLAEILPLESADMQYISFRHKDDTIEWIPQLDTPSKYDIPCWSLSALLDAIPERIIKNYYVPNLQKEDGKYSIAYGDDELLCIADNPIDACVAMVEKLNELKLL